MTRQEIAAMIASVGLPYAYDHFTEADAPGSPPFICFTLPSSDHFAADGVVYFKLHELNVELYTDNKAPELEEAVESALDAAGLFYQSSETYIPSERMYMVTWTAQVALS